MLEEVYNKVKEELPQLISDTIGFNRKTWKVSISISSERSVYIGFSIHNDKYSTKNVFRYVIRFSDHNVSGNKYIFDREDLRLIEESTLKRVCLLSHNVVTAGEPPLKDMLGVENIYNYIKEHSSEFRKDLKALEKKYKGDNPQTYSPNWKTYRKR